MLNQSEPPTANNNNASKETEEQKSCGCDGLITETFTDPAATEWLKFNSSNTGEDNSCSFHISKELYEERLQMTKDICSRKSLGKKPNPSSKDRRNSLSTNSANQKVRAYQTFIPNKITDSFEGIGSRIYNCSFDTQGDTLFATSQTGTVLFDSAIQTEMKLKKTIRCNYITWAITDSDYTEDSRFMIHSTLSPNVQLFDVENQKYMDQLNMSITSEEEENSVWYYGFRIYSTKISADGTQVISGTSRSLDGKARLQIYDVPSNKLVNSISAHDNDINSIAYIDKQNSSLIISGSDDGLCKLWDTRSLGSNKPTGIFYGHLSGVTSVESKGDSRYFISNSKDQSIKLWDLRICSQEEKQYFYFGFDYRMEELSSLEIEKIKTTMKKNPQENSVMTFFGHQVYVTLIRCHFSPKFNTDQRYIYCGSTDGSVYIYDTLSGKHVARLELGVGRVVRDCAWHPFNQSIVTSDFGGNICKWEYFDLAEV